MTMMVVAPIQLAASIIPVMQTKHSAGFPLLPMCVQQEK